MKRYLLAVVLTLTASPAVAYHKKTCLDWVKFLTGAVQIEAMAADERLQDPPKYRLAPGLNSRCSPAELDAITAKAAWALANEANKALIQCSIEADQAPQ